MTLKLRRHSENLISDVSCTANIIVLSLTKEQIVRMLLSTYFTEMDMIQRLRTRHIVRTREYFLIISLHIDEHFRLT